jgi:hypothetical protein
MQVVKSLPKLVTCSIYLVLPVILFLFAISLKEARGPHFINSYDPDYPYLTASLNAADFRSSELIYHPGIPVQMVGGVILRAYSPNYLNLQKDVLSQPELYLNRLNYFVIGITVILFISVGVTAFFLTGDILPGLLIQITPFLSNSILRSLIRFNPEPFLIISSFFLILIILIKSLRSKAAYDNDRTLLSAFAIIGGFGLAVKVTFFPLLIIPIFLLTNFSTIIKYISFTMAAFVLILLPYYNKIINAVTWYWKIFSHTGIYGKGRVGIIDLSTLHPNIVSLFQAEPVFMYSLLLVIAFTGVNLFNPRLRKIALKSIHFKVLMGLSVANTIGLIMILKHFGVKYLVPSFCLTGLMVAFLYIYLNHLSSELGFSKRLVNLSFILIFTLIGLFSYCRLPNLEQDSLKRDKNLVLHQRVMDEYKDWKKIVYFGQPSKHYALFFGNGWAGSRHSGVLESIYGKNFFFYHHGKGIFCNWHGKISPAIIVDNLENIIIFGPDKDLPDIGKSIIATLQKDLASYDLTSLNTVNDAPYDTILKFNKSGINP